MAEQKKEFFWKYESVLDHDITPEQFKAVTGFDWERRFEYLQSVVNSPYAGCRDIVELYGGLHSRPRNNNKCKHYSELAARAPMIMDYCD